jgi:NADH:ubiquinone oxidoreductase subunit B-like Fe-S oxidoreductase
MIVARELLNSRTFTSSVPIRIGDFLRICIIERPTRNLGGFDLSHFGLGQVYDVAPRLAELLVVCGYAEPVMRELSGQQAGPPGEKLP